MSVIQNYKKKSFLYLHGLIHHIEPEVFFVKNSKELLQALTEAFQYCSLQKILLITSNISIHDALLENLNTPKLISNIHFVHYRLTDNQATVFHVEKALHTYISNQCQAVFILGDTSAIDLGKAVKARILNPNRNLYQMRGFANIPVRKQNPPLFIVPLSLAGNESNLSSRVLSPNHLEKILLIDRIFSADYIFYCPDLLINLSVEQFIGSLCIALANALETSISKNATRNSKAAANLSIKMFLDALQNPSFAELLSFFENSKNESAYSIPQNFKEDSQEIYALLTSLQRAADFSGKAASKSLAGYIEVMANALEAHYRVVDYKITPILFLAVLKMYRQKLKTSENQPFPDSDNFSQLLKEVGTTFVKLISKQKLPQHLSFLRITDFDSIIALVEREIADYYSFPFILDKNNISAILKSLQ